MGLVIWGACGAALGLIAKWVMPGPDPIGILGATLLGTVAALLGGAVSTLAGEAPWSGMDPRSLLVAVISSLVMLFAYRSYAMRWST